MANTKKIMGLRASTRLMQSGAAGLNKNRAATSGRFFIVFNVGECKDVKVVKAPEKPTATWFPQPAYAEGPFKTKFDVIKRLNQMDVPASNRPEGYQAINMAKGTNNPQGYKIQYTWLAKSQENWETKTRVTQQVVSHEIKKIGSKEYLVFKTSKGTSSQLPMDRVFNLKVNKAKGMTKPAGKETSVVQKSKVKSLILSIAHDIASSGIDFLPGGNLDVNLKALKIPKKKWGDYIAWIWDANVIGTGLTLEELQKRVANQEDIPAVKADEFAEYVKPKTRFLKWLSTVERWASDNYGRMVVISVDDFVESEENGDTVKVNVKENEQFAKEAFTKGYFLKTKMGGMKYVVHDEKIWTRLHKLKEGIPI